MTDTTTPKELRAAMLDAVRTMGFARHPDVGQALRTVPRHAFVPEADLDEAYGPYQAVITKRAGDGTSLSCASAPYIVGMMLDQLTVRPGDHVLEIGAGTGYNAALLAELTGRNGGVTTVDVDPEVTTQAVHALTSHDYRTVRVLTRDGADGAAEYAPFDRIIATVSPWDIPTAWWQQLAPGGRLVVPLRWRGQTRSVAFAEQHCTLVSDSVELCGFVYLTGNDDGEQTAPITRDETVRLHWDGDQSLDPAALLGVLDKPRVTAWSGITVAGDEPFDGIWLRLTATDARTCRLNAQPDVPAEICNPAMPLRSPALVQGSSLAYLTSRRYETDTGPRWEKGAHGHGPDAHDLVQHLCTAIRGWSQHREWCPTLTAYPAGTPDTALPGPAIDKKHSRLVLTTPDE